MKNERATFWIISLVAFMVLILPGCAVVQPGPDETFTRNMVDESARIIGDTVEKLIRVPGRIVGDGVAAPILDPAYEGHKQRSENRRQKKHARVSDQIEELRRQQNEQNRMGYCQLPGNKCEVRCVEILTQIGLSPECPVIVNSDTVHQPVDSATNPEESSEPSDESIDPPEPNDEPENRGASIEVPLDAEVAFSPADCSYRAIHDDGTDVCYKEIRPGVHAPVARRQKAE